MLFWYSIDELCLVCPSSGNHEFTEKETKGSGYRRANTTQYTIRTHYTLIPDLVSLRQLSEIGT